MSTQRSFYIATSKVDMSQLKAWIHGYLADAPAQIGTEST
jgi:hypothetical protein